MELTKEQAAKEQCEWPTTTMAPPTILSKDDKIKAQFSILLAQLKQDSNITKPQNSAKKQDWP